MSLLTSSYWLPANVGGGGAKPKEEGTAGEGPRREAKGEGDCRVCCKRESVLKWGRRPKKKKERDVLKFGL